MLMINNADSYWVDYHGRGDNDWGTPQVVYLSVKLTAGTNSLKISNPSGYIADIDWITVWSPVCGEGGPRACARPFRLSA